MAKRAATKPAPEKSKRNPAAESTDCTVIATEAAPAAVDSTVKVEKVKAAPAASKKDRTPRKTAAQAVRDYLISNPTARNRDIVTALAAQGMVIDDSIPAQIKSRDKKGRKPKPAPVAVPAELASASKTQAVPTIFVHAPIHEDFAKDLLAVRTHSQAVKNLRILVARLERIIVIMETLKEDDWQITLLAQSDGLLFSAIHAQAHTGAQVRARLEKLAIQPKEVVLVG